LLFGVLLTIICLIFLNPLVRVLGTDQQSFLPTRDYVAVLFLSLPVLMANFAIEQIVRSTGAARQSMNGMILSIGANFLFDVLFILILHLNVIGAALAIALSNVASLVYYLLYLRVHGGPVKLAVKYFLVTKVLLKEVFSIGASELIMSSFMIVTALLFNNLAVQYGDYVIASLGVALRIVQLPEFMCMGICLGVMPLLGYAYGSKNSGRLKAALQQSALAIAGFIAVFSTIVFLFRSEIFSWFSSDHQVVAFGSYILIAMLVSSLFNGFTGLILAYFQTTNKPLQTTIMSFAQGGLFIPVILVAHALFGLTGIVWSMTITETLTCLIGVGLFLFIKDKKMLAQSATSTSALT
ncbi:MAG TPA: MATE family efflux transporter, partial [Ktedonobacteraceae bacterium]|nr:MATE family efflux transporter [Ktedonobacteraceae bacterium]